MVLEDVDSFRAFLLGEFEFDKELTQISAVFLGVCNGMLCGNRGSIGGGRGGEERTTSELVWSLLRRHGRQNDAKRALEGVRWRCS